MVNSSMENLQRCSRCRKQKELGEFKDGRKVCNYCLSSAKTYQQNNPEKMAEKCHKYYVNHRNEILEQKREKRYCDLCKVEVAKSEWTKHLITSRHKRYQMIEAGEKLEADRGDSWWCDVCQVFLAKKTSKCSHNGSKRHCELAKSQGVEE